MDAFRRASAVLFYALGLIVLVLVIVVRNDAGGEWASTLLHVLDLPLLLFGMIYGGLSLMGSMTNGKTSPTFLAVIGLLLGALFLIFAWFNFGMPPAASVM